MCLNRTDQGDGCDFLGSLWTSDKCVVRRCGAKQDYRRMHIKEITLLGSS